VGSVSRVWRLEWSLMGLSLYMVGAFGRGRSSFIHQENMSDRHGINGNIVINLMCSFFPLKCVAPSDPFPKGTRICLALFPWTPFQQTVGLEAVILIPHHVIGPDLGPPPLSCRRRFFGD
jgi:hypothetical protein